MPPAACTEASETIVIDAQPVPVDLIFFIDRSGSMSKTVEGAASSDTRYNLVLTALERLIVGLRPGLQVALLSFPALDEPQAQRPRDALPAEAIGFCATCSQPDCSFEACQSDTDCASGLCSGALCACDTQRACNAGFRCAERFCDGGPPIAEILESLPSGGLADQIAACVGPSECWALRDDRQAQCRSFNEIFRDPQGAQDARATCQPQSYAHPTIGFTFETRPLLQAITRLAAAGPKGDTPLGPALAGAQEYVETQQASFADRRVVQVVMTDGEPTDCDALGAPEIRMMLADRSTGSFKIPTFVVGVFEPNAPQIAELHAWAEAGGTDGALVVGPGSDFARDFERALQHIQEAVSACEWALPPDVDPDHLQIDLELGPEAPERLAFIATADACDDAPDGWYFDAPPESGRTPTSVRACPAVCARLQQDLASVRFVVSCDETARDVY